MKSSPHSLQLEEACTKQWKPRATRKLKLKKKINKIHFKQNGKKRII